VITQWRGSEYNSGALTLPKKKLAEKTAEHSSLAIFLKYCIFFLSIFRSSICLQQISKIGHRRSGRMR
jgi:hypothetical protein